MSYTCRVTEDALTQAGLFVSPFTHCSHCHCGFILFRANVNCGVDVCNLLES